MVLEGHDDGYQVTNIARHVLLDELFVKKAGREVLHSEGVTTFLRSNDREHT